MTEKKESPKKEARDSDPVWQLIRQGISKAEAIAIVARQKADNQEGGK